ncbi:IclR family transcriptional regulator [Sneathiella sp.]|uniref:IclR family transcriptional regulator n=1 Tax=Sneathiella sp. TaxID=1964365 RepID=UPI002FE3BF01
MEVPAPLVRYNQILEIVSCAPQGISLGELVEASGLPRSTAHRLAAALCAVGYVEMQEDGHYSIGPGLLKLLKRSLAASAMDYLPRALLASMTAELGETAFFARRVEKHIDLLEAVPPESTGRSYVYPGTGARPVDTCSSSKAILAYLEDDTAREIYEAYLNDGNAPSHDWGAFSRELENVRKNGIAICDGEIDEGVYSVACPVIVANMPGLFSIGVVGPTARMKALSIDRLQGVLQDSAEQASHYITERLFRDAGQNDQGK